MQLLHCKQKHNRYSQKSQAVLKVSLLKERFVQTEVRHVNFVQQPNFDVFKWIFKQICTSGPSNSNFKSMVEKIINVLLGRLLVSQLLVSQLLVSQLLIFRARQIFAVLRKIQRRNIQRFIFMYQQKILCANSSGF